VRHFASRNPDSLVIGVDANADALRETSRRFAAKPSRGGLSNALLGRLPLADAPGELFGLADSLTVLLPWGSLLRAVAVPDRDALGALRALVKTAATLRVLFGYGPRTDGAAIRAHDLPALDVPKTLGVLEDAYRDAGFMVKARVVDTDEVRELPTTWARRLAYSGHERRFLELTGNARSP
jgi:16S rRNA (adenine(1408)-N(1))-methyltransferase